ncbi:hypothetical protein [Amaricoccus solimangrovi]|uniref:Uncharacterized protein n=1 Tax=Amaricoccus solimangrovi TaxID=2589815 RepID=A0A501WCZ8_9RHOB|nr:hypothetical protein [Amaricoccus solimangrovi]TPE45081.1 hypothetical protein FJM51_22800 [Amaricoccus solimangrovi]
MRRLTLFDVAYLALVTVAVWIGVLAAQVTSAEIDRWLHPLECPPPYEMEGPADPAPSPEENSFGPVMPALDEAPAI